MTKTTDDILDEAGVRSMKQRLFCIAYFESEYNGSEAVRKAGYNTQNENRIAHELLQKEHIKLAIKLLAEARAEQVSVKPEYVLRKLVRTIEKAEEQNNHGAVLRGAELLARHLGMFIERTEISGRDGEAIKMEKIQNDSDALESAIARLARRGREDGVPKESQH